MSILAGNPSLETVWKLLNFEIQVIETKVGFWTSGRVACKQFTVLFRARLGKEDEREGLLGERRVDRQPVPESVLFRTRLGSGDGRG